MMTLERIEGLRDAEGQQNFHPGYYARQLHINTARGVYNRLETIRIRMVSESDCPAWLMVQLNEAMAKLQYLVQPLEEHRDEMLPGGLLDELERLRRERDEIQETLTTVEGEVAKVYCHVTGDRFSKCNTRSIYVTEAADEFYRSHYYGIIVDDLTGILDDGGSLDDVRDYVASLLPDKNRDYDA